MTGPKEKKGGGSKQQQQSGGALFPRLNVAETKRSGPRAPPRNKMALYEQFTIPSHTFKATPMPLPLNSNRMVSTPPLNGVYQPIQPQVPSGSYDSRYSTYTPVTYRSPISPAMAYMPIMSIPQYGYGGQGSMNFGSANTVVDGVTELQRVPLGASMPTPSPRSVDHSRQSGASKKGKEDDDFAVPTYSSATHGSSQTRPSTSAQVQETSAGQSKGRESVKDKQLRTSVHQRRNRAERMDVTSVDQTDNRSCQTGSGQCVTVTAIDNGVGSGEPRNSDGEVQQVCQGESVVSVSEVEQETGHKRKVDPRDKDASKTSEPTAAVAQDTLQHGGNLWGVPEQECQSSESSQNHSGQESETEPSQPRRVISDETKSSTLENVPAVAVTPRDVIQAIGQQEFWKAHNVIMRQQKMFSEQVYELHRITEVQLMIAKSPSSFLYLAAVELEEEEEEEDAPAPASPAAEVPEVPTRCLEHSSARKAGNDRRPAVESISNKPLYPVVKPPQQSFVAGNPYQAYPYGVTPWAARMGSPYMYVPYPSPYPPAYGMYPVMGVDMSMYAQRGVIQGARYPALAATNISSWGSQDPTASAWYGSQQVPVMGATGTAAITALEPGCRLVRVDSSGASSQAQTSDLNKESDRQGGDHPHAVAERADKAAQHQENFGWAKGWGMNEERWGGRDENALQNSGSGRINRDERKDECQEQDGACEPFPPLGGAKLGAADPAVEEIEEGGEKGVERGLAGGLAERRALQERSSNRTHAEGLEPDRIPWFSVIPPPIRNKERSGVIKVVPRPLGATPESTASILQSIQRERRQL